MAKIIDILTDLLLKIRNNFIDKQVCQEGEFDYMDAMAKEYENYSL
ncbi:hypothetical protein CBE01nite_29850 [Clostridium beijerinckii]|uniref:Uncharacterized protein n=1 Tax=Clostridium beijerinckii TaxID=1520 RepID=A0AB74VDJ2_CLOBE|nr:hypothetical protein [Clostridium beijerinckii]NRZ28765.1 hypothetical protein [Clostridium beijerinckii]NYB95459.1 hypothetical protein [Clostridium beijerinckii]OOM24574.1 hypothetical protein CLBEI_20350 [Clostridium beijerinckii]QUN34442.1 hypothetical protein KEC93_21340 [Clostridium beijerinckii]SQB00603.1 Uncharacterised protein [Clostridium beijerinckii]